MGDDSDKEDGGLETRAEDDSPVIGSPAIRPIFLGNLLNNYSTDSVKDLFENPPQPPNSERPFQTLPIDRVDLKRGYCFVFLKDVSTQRQKEETERFVADINGMDVKGVSRSIRAEFARGDGRVKRQEDERRKNIAPSETLFVVNFHEETTKREDLQMLFEPYGTLVRIDMKRNYAFVQFKTIQEAKHAKESTNGGKLDQSVLTVEYVAQRRDDSDRGGGDGRGRDDRRRPRYDDRSRHRRDPYPDYRDRPRGGGRYDRDDYDDDYRRRDRRDRRGGSGQDPHRHGPPPPTRGGGERRYRSRSRSPPRRPRSPSPRYRDRSPDYGRGYR